MNCWSHRPRSSRTSHSIDKPLFIRWWHGLFVFTIWSATELKKKNIWGRAHIWTPPISITCLRPCVTQMAMPNPSQVPCAPRPNKDIPCSGNTALCCVVLKCLRQANTINTAKQCHALTLTIYLFETSTPLTCVTIKRLTSAPWSFSQPRGSVSSNMNALLTISCFIQALFSSTSVCGVHFPAVSALRALESSPA